MFPKSKSWMSGSGGVFKPKNPHSLEHLKYLYGVLGKNQTVTEQNLSLLVETLRSISEILIWGDQNDSSVFDFFLEKNMLVFFLKFMRQRSGQCICVQLLQTLNILFDNITNETSVYYLLSNNHINSIIIHKFDFSDEEVMAYYISFLKTLSMKLNKHTIHFFYNEHTNDFALYTEAIKFFNHSESMVRIAVRTITLNVYRACHFTSQLDEHGQPIVDDRSMLRYIRDKTAAPYFSNLVWFIGNHVLELDLCVKQDIDHNSRSKLSDLVAEHLDHLHYLNDILCLNIDALNEVLTDHLLNRLLIPLYVKSLLPSRTDSSEPSNERTRTDDSPRIDPTVSLFLLSQVFLIMHHAMLVRQLADIIFNGDISVCENRIERESAEATKLRCFVKPDVPLAQILENCRLEAPRDSIYHEEYLENEIEGATAAEAGASSVLKLGQFRDRDANQDAEASLPADDNSDRVHRCLDPHPNSTDEEKLMQNSTVESILQIQTSEFNLDGRPFLEAVFSSLDCSKDDYKALFSLCLLYALGHNSGINQDLLDAVHMPTDLSQTKHHYNTTLVQQLINIMSLACQNNSKIRLATLELTILLVRTLAYKEGHCFLQDCHLAEIEGVREEATLQLRNFYKVWEKSEEIFLDMFEDEHRELLTKPLNVEYLTMDASILLHPTGTPLTGIDFCRRLPCGEVERARRAIRVFFVVRDLSFALRQEPETELPLTKDSECAKVNDVLDLNNSDLIACTVVFNENKKERRFLVIDVIQLILVEPDPKRLGWGVVRFVGFLQDAEVTGDKEDSRCLHVTIHKPTMNFAHGRPQPLLVARFVFDDHIRCMAARQRLTKGRLKARQRKMQMIARLLDLPSHLVDSIYPQQGSGAGGSHSSSLMLRPGSASAAFPGQAQRRRTTPVKDVDNQSQSSSSKKSDSDSRDSIQRSVFASVDQVPAFNMAAKEQDHERRSRRLKAKLAGSIARQQLIAKNLQASGAEGSTSQQSAEAKKMYLSMAKEAKRSYQMRALNRPADQSSSIEEKVSTDIAAKSILRPRSAMLPDRSSSLPESPNRGKLRSCLPVPVKAGSLEICMTVDHHRERERTRSESAEIGVQTVKDDKVRKLSGPKSLSRADGIPVSLVDLCVDDHLASSSASTYLDSPIKLLPPAQADDIRKFASGETAENVDLSTGLKQPQSDLELPDSVE